MSWMRAVFRYAWASPWTVLGLMAGALALLFGATVRRQGGALEFEGGHMGRWVSRWPAPFSFSAITFGHVILGTDAAMLAAVRAHEQVHVRQYDRWGPFFIPAYLLASLVQWMRGRDPYRDNPFEREAYERAASQGRARAGMHDA